MMTTKEMMMKIDKIFVGMMVIAGVFYYTEALDRIKEGAECKVELKTERLINQFRETESAEVGKAVERIRFRLIEDKANEWCSDSMDLAWEQVIRLEEDCKYQKDMSNVSDIWEDYVDARIQDCESRGLKTEIERLECLGPAGKYEIVQRAIEAMTIHQMSVGIQEGV